MVFYGKGGYSFETIYNMPIWLRKFVFNKILEHYDSENNKTNNNVQKSIDVMKSTGFTKENLNTKKTTPPTYITKASKK